MKQIVLAAMAALTLAGPASATSDWDYFWGTTLNPANTGWNDFWYQCQDPNKTHWDCVGTMAAGVGAVIALPLVAIGVVATGVGVLTGGTSVAVVTIPVAGAYISASGVVMTVPIGGNLAGMSPAGLTASGTFIAL